MLEIYRFLTESVMDSGVILYADLFWENRKIQFDVSHKFKYDLMKAWMEKYDLTFSDLGFLNVDC